MRTRAYTRGKKKIDFFKCPHAGSVRFPVVESTSFAATTSAESIETESYGSVYAIYVRLNHTAM